MYNHTVGTVKFALGEEGFHEFSPQSQTDLILPSSAFCSFHNFFN